MQESRITVFLVAGTRLLREALTRILSKRSDISVAGAEAPSPQAIREISNNGARVLLLDTVAGHPLMIDFLQEALRAAPELKVVMIGMENDEQLFLQYVRAGAVGYVLKEAAAGDVVSAVRAVAQGEAVCPPSLCLTLFREVFRLWSGLPNVRVKLQFGLTRREQQLVPLIARGLTNKEIAALLNLSEQTVKNHIHRMMQKVGADDRLIMVESCLGYPRRDWQAARPLR